MFRMPEFWLAPRGLALFKGGSMSGEIKSPINESDVTVGSSYGPGRPAFSTIKDLVQQLAKKSSAGLSPAVM